MPTIPPAESAGLPAAGRGLTSMRRAAAAAALSALLPGLGQAFNGERSKAVSALAISLGLIVTVAVLHVLAGAGVADEVASLVPIYALVWAPGVTDAWLVGRGGRTRLLAGESRAYVITMISCSGPLALPLLWQSPRFGSAAKVLWTAMIVIGVAVFVWAWIMVGPAIDELMRDLKALDQA